MAHQHDARVHDLSDSFRNACWTGHRQTDEQLFDAGVRSLTCGVYVHYLQNDHDHPVHDRNGESVGRGKLLVLPRAGTIKFGKFEGGLLKRRSQDADHMHRRAPLPAKAEAGPASAVSYPASPNVFAECIRLALVLDLSGCDDAIERVRAAERHLRRQIPSLLAALSLRARDQRGDYRILDAPLPTGSIAHLRAWSLEAFSEILDVNARATSDAAVTES